LSTFLAADDAPEDFTALFLGPLSPESAEEHAARATAARDVLADLREEAERDTITARNAAYAEALMNVARCQAAHPEDRTACVGPKTAVRIVDRHGEAVLACVHHGARMYASLIGPRVYPMPGHDRAAIDVYRRALELPPFVWLRRTPGRCCDPFRSAA
jgi:hypothetical protein